MNAADVPENPINYRSIYTQFMAHLRKKSRKIQNFAPLAQHTRPIGYRSRAVGYTMFQKD